MKRYKLLFLFMLVSVIVQAQQGGNTSQDSIHKRVNEILSRANYPGYRRSFVYIEDAPITSFSSSDDFDSIAREKIHFLIAGKYTQDDFNRHLEVYKRKLLNRYDSDIDFSPFWLNYLKRQVAKGRDEQEVRDSLYEVWLARDLPKFKMPIDYHKELIYLIGMNYMYDFVPHLESLIDTAEGFPVYLTKLVLARLGVEPYLSEILDTLEKFEYVPDIDIIDVLSSQVMFVANYPRSVDIFKKWLYVKYKINFLGLRQPIDCAYFSAHYLANMLKYAPQKYKICSHSWYDCPETIEFKQWVKEHPDSLEIDSMAYWELFGGVWYTNVNIKSFREKYQKALEEGRKQLARKEE